MFNLGKCCHLIVLPHDCVSSPTIVTIKQDIIRYGENGPVNQWLLIDYALIYIWLSNLTMTLGAPGFNETGSTIKDNLCNVVSQQRQKI